LQSLHNNKSNYVEKPVGFRIPKFEWVLFFPFIMETKLFIMLLSF
jgi:hypothetical protein